MEKNNGKNSPGSTHKNFQAYQKKIKCLRSKLNSTIPHLPAWE